MTTSSRRRLRPPVLDPIVVDGVRYSEERQANKYDHVQQSGFLMASDVNTDAQLWLLKVYEIDYIEGKETDVQEVYFLEMKLSDDGKHIQIENELEQQFVVDIENQTVSGN